MKQPSIVIVDYGVGNTYSVWNAVRSLNYYHLKVSNQHQDIISADVLLLPGVGAFDACMRNLQNLNMIEVLNDVVLVKKKPILGICVGMQLMADISEENGQHKGLGWIPGRVSKLDLSPPYTVPHVGWNDLKCTKSSPLFSLADKAPHFYFDHSYHYHCDAKFVTATCDYPHSVIASISHEHIHGVQFHPEKSQINGLKLFRGFFNAISQC